MAQWRSLVKKSQEVEDPYHDFDANIKAERATRWDFDILTGKWEKTRNVIVRLESEKFAHGSLRDCYRMKMMQGEEDLFHMCNWSHANNLVAKLYQEKVGRDMYLQDVKVQMLSKHFGHLFSESGPPKKVDFMQAFVIELSERPDRPLYACEGHLAGDYSKYNSNAGYVEDSKRNTPQAFSHFTYEASRNHLLVVDIQGVQDLYTDPQIHTWDGEGFGKGNLGIHGFSLFFHSHRCNPICKTLGLTTFPSYGGGLYSPQLFKDSTISKSFMFTSVSAIRNDFLLRSGSVAKISRPDKEGTAQNPGDALPKRRGGSKAPVGDFSQSKVVLRQAVSGDLELADVIKQLADLTTDSVERKATVDAFVHYQIAQYHESGRFNEGQETKEFDRQHTDAAALFHIFCAAKGGLAAALLLLARIYADMHVDILSSIEIPSSPELSNRYLRFAADRGSREAMYNVAVAYDAGTDGTPNKKLAAKYFEMYLNTPARPKKEKDDNDDDDDDDDDAEEEWNLASTIDAVVIEEGDANSNPGNNLPPVRRSNTNLFLLSAPDDKAVSAHASPNAIRRVDSGSAEAKTPEADSTIEGGVHAISLDQVNDVMDDCSGWSVEGVQDWQLRAKLAEFYENGYDDEGDAGQSETGVKRDYPKAAELYRDAADAAMACGRGRASMTYYEKAEICDSM